MNSVPRDYAEAILAGMLAIWPYFLAERCEARCPRCLQTFTYRKKKGTYQPKYCLECVKY